MHFVHMSVCECVENKSEMETDKNTKEVIFVMFSVCAIL